MKRNRIILLFLSLQLYVGISSAQERTLLEVQEIASAFFAPMEWDTIAAAPPRFTTPEITPLVRDSSTYLRQSWSADRQVTTHTPPCLIVGCQDDDVVPIRNSILFYQALTAAHVPASLVIVPQGGHGWGFLRHFPDRELIDQAILSFLR